MASSLGYTTLDGKTTNPTNNFYVIDESDQIQHKYFVLLESYKKQFVTNESNPEKNELTDVDIQFLENVVKIKTKIATLTQQHRHIVDHMFEIDKDIDELEKIKHSYIDIIIKINKYIRNCPVLPLNEESVESEKIDKKLTDIKAVLKSMKEYLETYTIKKEKLANEIQILKNIIYTNDDSEAKKDNIPTCFICRENPIDCCLNPCGHTCCVMCSSKLATQKCYICRGLFTSKTKMFFDNASEIRS